MMCATGPQRTYTSSSMVCALGALYLSSFATTAHARYTPQEVEEEGSLHIFSSQLRTDQMPGPPSEAQLTCALFLNGVIRPSNTNDVILPHG